MRATSRSGAIVLLSMALVGAPAVASGDEALREARVAIQDGRAADAVGPLEARVSVEPSDGAAWLWLAEARFALEDWAGALDAARRASAHPPASARAWWLIARVHARLEEIEAALDAYSIALRRGFNDPGGIARAPELAELRAHPRFRPPAGREIQRVAVAGRPAFEVSIVAPWESEASDRVLLALSPGAGAVDPVDFTLDAYLGGQAAERGWTTVAPVTPPEGWGSPQGLAAFDALWESVLAPRVGEDGRVHLVGIDHGGSEAFALAIERPERFETLVVAPGQTSERRPLGRLRDVRVLQLVGEYDGGWVSGAQRSVRTLERLGVDATLEIVPGEGHVLGSLMGDGLVRRIERHVAGR